MLRKSCRSRHASEEFRKYFDGATIGGRRAKKHEKRSISRRFQFVRQFSQSASISREKICVTIELALLLVIRSSDPPKININNKAKRKERRKERKRKNENRKQEEARRGKGPIRKLDFFELNPGFKWWHVYFKRGTPSIRPKRNLAARTTRASEIFNTKDYLTPEWREYSVDSRVRGEAGTLVGERSEGQGDGSRTRKQARRGETRVPGARVASF